MDPKHAEPFFGITNGDYAKLSPNQHAGVIVNYVSKDFIFEVFARVQKNKCSIINVLKAPQTSEFVWCSRRILQKSRGR
jgi:hypothetical protein